MAVTIKEIHEKDFSRQVRGYAIDEVDDFLDEIAAYLEQLLKENRALNQKLEEKPAPAEPVAAVAAPVPAIPAPPAVAQLPAPVPAPVQAEQVSKIPPPFGDEPAYFKNLEATLRETLISAQRIADETVSEARKKANALVGNAEEKASVLVNNAQEQANAILATSKVEAESVRLENAEIRKAAEDYRGRFLRLVEDHMHVLKADGSLFS